jgi:hypothetical protein
MRRIASLVLAAGAATGLASVGSATSAEAGGWCPPYGYSVVYYAPPPCCYGYAYRPYVAYGPYYYTYFPYYKSTQYWPARPYYSHRVSHYGPFRVRRR